jgi:hypothetical protein
MNYGTRSARVKLYSSSETKGSFGQLERTKTLDRTTWAGYSYGPSKKSDLVTAADVVDCTFYLRYFPGVTTDWFVEHAGATYQVTHVEPYPREGRLVLKTRATL